MDLLLGQDRAGSEGQIARIKEEIVEAAVEQDAIRERGERVRRIPGQTEVIAGVPTATGPLARHWQVQLSKATARLKRSVRRYRQATNQ